ncbi:NAD(P)-dependent oxidoreductase [Streptomyces sp. SP18CS02]|uniref:NAD(P)-dependent oxidoreductase n=1 Tax=Streptomyces sp. SP18CS02 TaxID=3002531 RepID=UPI002E79D117|nr:NAD(P)H-binding protein [Streptomyces sp. SP18CS02]MEE1751759.1 NAD(P)H-binding protein [Streptomyces sp. SP18CS02]
MRLTVFGASGGIGRQIVEQALAAGHHVTAVVRDPGAVTATGGRLEVAPVRFDDPGALRAAVAGRDAVLSGLGPRSRKHVGVASALTRLVVEALEETGTRRFLAVSAAPLGPVPRDETPYLRVMTPLVSRILREHYDDLRVMEADLRRGSTDWTVLRPPRLVDRPLTGVYRTAVGAGLRGGARIARADAAHAMLALIDDPSALRQPVAVAY